jgi:hypothetical protein
MFVLQTEFVNQTLVTKLRLVTLETFASLSKACFKLKININ